MNTLNQKVPSRSNISPDKPISGISLILDFGHGAQDLRGKYGDRFSQADVVDVYGRRVAEEFETDGIRVFNIETRKAPGTPVDARHRLGPLTFVPLILTCDWDETKRLHNFSRIQYQGPQYLELATRIGEALLDWGRCYVWGHKVGKPERIPDIVDQDQRGFIRVSPFSLNGAHADEYLTRLEELGLSVGRAVSDYLIERGSAPR